MDTHKNVHAPFLGNFSIHWNPVSFVIKTITNRNKQNTKNYGVFDLSCIAPRPSFLRVRADAIFGSSTIFHV